MKSKLRFLRFVFSALFFIQVLLVKAQCPATVTATIASQTNATCPSNGTIAIGSNANSIPSATYQAVVAPSGVSLAIQSSNVFTSLPAGNYTFKVLCGSSSATVNATVTSSYTQLTGTAIATNMCYLFASGATVIASGSGGTTPYTFAIRKTNNPNYADNLSVYGTADQFVVTDTGVYQVRIKDNCGNFITRSVNVYPTVPQVTLVPEWMDYYNSCGSTQGTLYYDLTDKNGTQIGLIDLAYGLKIDVYEKTTGCTRGAFIETIYTGTSSDQSIVIPNNKNLYIKLTNVCGDTSFTCYNAVPPDPYVIHWNIVQTGCPNATYPNGLVTLGLDWTENSGPGFEYFSVETLSGTVVRTATKDSSAFHGLPYGTYVVKGTNGCSATASTTLVPEAIGATAFFGDWYSGFDFCTNQTGTLTYNAWIGGSVYDLEHAVTTITAGPSNVGIVGFSYPTLGIIRWRNMLPGNYTASVVSACASKLINFTVSSTEPVLYQTLNVSVQQVCGSGSTINAALNYNGTGTVTYELYNSSNTLIRLTAGGVFTNEAPGSYTVKARIQLNSWDCGSTSYTVDKPVTIVPNGAAPQVVKKIVMVCEDVNGVPTANGKAIIRMNGFGPFKVEVKKVTDPDASYVIKFAATSIDFTIDNLVAYQDYRVRITDQCGNTAQTDVSVGILQQFAQSSAVGPCLGQAYTISAPDMIDATYSWTKGGVNVGTTKDLVFANWNTSNNGTYLCTIVIGGGCVTRTYSAQVNSFYCGVLPIKLESFVATTNNCKNILTWSIINQADLAKLQIEKSVDGVNFTTLKSFEKVNNTQIAKTQFVDANPAKGNSYYRLLLVEKDGQKMNSPIATVKNNCNGEQANDLIVFPNPISNNVINVFVANTTTGYANIKLINHLGQNVLEQKVKTTENSTTLNLDVQALANGAYTLIVTNANGKVLQQKVIKL
jgi:hypothetical protein